MERLIVVLTSANLPLKETYISRSESRYFVYWNTNQKIVWVIWFVLRESREDTKEFHYDALGHLV